MEDEQIYKKIEEIYNSEKGKGFIIHLLRSFFPIYKSQYLLESPKNGEIKCCITGKKLSSKEECMKLIMSGEMEDAFINSLKASMETNKFVLPEKLKTEMYSLAVTCEDSDKYLSKEAFQQLLNFYQTRILMGDKHINWIAHNEQAKEVVNEMKKNGIVKTKKEEKVIHKITEKSGRPTFGDLEALKELKKRMMEEEKKEDK